MAVKSIPDLLIELTYSPLESKTSTFPLYPSMNMKPKLSEETASISFCLTLIFFEIEIL